MKEKVIMLGNEAIARGASIKDLREGYKSYLSKEKDIKKQGVSTPCCVWLS